MARVYHELDDEIVLSVIEEVEELLIGFGDLTVSVPEGFRAQMVKRLFSQKLVHNHYNVCLSHGYFSREWQVSKLRFKIPF